MSESRPEELEMISKATSELQLIRHTESCKRLGVPITEIINVPKDKIPSEVDSDFLAFTRVRAPREKLNELITYIKAVETIAEQWDPS